MLKETISPLILNRLPEFLHDEYPKLISLLTEYFEWLEEDGNYTRVLLDFKHDLDVSNESDNYIDSILKDLGFDTTSGLKIKKSHLVYFLRDYYLSQGNTQSFKFLFKAFFDENVEVAYPRHKLAYASNASYGGHTSIFTTADSTYDPKILSIMENSDNWFSISVRGLQTNTISNIENAIRFEVNGKYYYQLRITTPNNYFDPSEAVEFKYGTLIFNESMVASGDVIINNGGSGYSVGDVILATASASKQIIPGQYMVSRISKGGVTDLIVSDGGSGYSVGDMIFVVGTNYGAGFSGEVTTVDGSGKITGAQILNPGWGFTSLPKLVVDGNGTGAYITALSSEIGSIKQVKAIHPLVYRTPSLCTVNVTSSGSGCDLHISPADTFPEAPDFLNKNNGMLGRNCVLTDSNLFQQFSYELQSNISHSAHAHISDKVHPVGYIRFNVLNIQSSEMFPIQEVEDITRFIIILSTINNMIIGAASLNEDDATSARRLTIVKNTYDPSVVRPDIMSINILDTHKFADSLDFVPADYNISVVDGLAKNSPMNQAFDATVTLI